MGRNKKKNTTHSESSQKNTAVVKEKIIPSGDDEVTASNEKQNPAPPESLPSPPPPPPPPPQQQSPVRRPPSSPPQEQEPKRVPSPQPVEVEACDSDPLLSPLESPTDGDDLEETVDILGNGQLIKKVIDKGLGRETRPSHGDSVVISYKGWLETGTLVDDVDSVSFTLGDGDVLQALDLALPLAECKECFELLVDPRFAYGSRGREPDVPSEASLRYLVTIISISDPPSFTTMNSRERVRLADLKRERGNHYFKREEYAFALNSYNKALTILTTPYEPSGEKSTEPSNDEVALSPELVDELEMKLENNLAAAQLKIQAYDAAIRSCDAVLRKDPRNFKAMFRKGKALLEQGDVDQAVPVLKMVHDMVPASMIVKAELQRARTQQQRERERWSRAANRMFPGLNKHTGQPVCPPTTQMRVRSFLFSRRGLSLLSIIFAILSVCLAWFFEALPKQLALFNSQ